MSSHLDHARLRISSPPILRLLLCLLCCAACLAPLAAVGQSPSEGPGGPILVVADAGKPSTDESAEAEDASPEENV